MQLEYTGPSLEYGNRQSDVDLGSLDVLQDPSVKATVNKGDMKFVNGYLLWPDNDHKEGRHTTCC